MNIPSVTYGQVLNLTRKLELAEQLRLFKALEQSLQQNRETLPPRSILELRGLGKEVWQNVDVDAYVDRERDSWDG